MEISDILYWINNRGSFAEGVEIYKKFGGSSILLNIFQTENSFTQSKLREEVVAIYRRIESGEIVLDKPNENKEDLPFTIYKPAQKRVDRDKLTPALKVAYARLGPLISEMSYLHNRIDLLPSDEARFLAAERIVQLSVERRKIFIRIDHFMDTGVDPELPAENPVLKKKPETLRQELLRLRVNRSKWKKKAHRYKDYLKADKRIKEIEEELKNAV